MKTIKSHTAALLPVLLLFSFRLEAAIYTYNATIDISTPFNIDHPVGSWDYLWIISGAPTFTIQPGDTVQGTILFAGNEALQFVGPANNASIDLTWVDFSSTTPTHTLSTTTLNGVIGLDTLLNPTSSGSFASGEIGTGFANISTPTAVSFTGFSYSTEVVSGSGQYRPYYFSAYTANDVMGAISVIPEPSMIGVFGIGLIILSRKHRMIAVRLKFLSGKRF